MERLTLTILIGVVILVAITIVIVIVSAISKRSREIQIPAGAAICIGCPIKSVSISRMKHPPTVQDVLKASYKSEIAYSGMVEKGSKYRPSFSAASFRDEGAQIIAETSFGEAARITGISESTTKPVTRDYEYYPMLDSYDADITQLQEYEGNPEELKRVCDAFPNCQGFNTSGQLKYQIRPSDEWTVYTDDPTQGLYILKGLRT